MTARRTSTDRPPARPATTRPVPGRQTSRRTLTPPDRYDFAGTLAALWLGPADPSTRLSGTDLWWAARTPDGPGTLHLCREAGVLAATGYGPGGGWVVGHSPDIAGLTDDVTGFAELARAHPVVSRAWHRHRGLRLTRTGLLAHHLPPVILAQKVTSVEAIRGYATLVRRFGEPAPGPVGGLLLPPDPAVLAATPAWALHPLGIEAKRADTLRVAATRARRLAYAPDPATATAWLTALPGIGPWTAAEVVRPAFGDPDTVTVGDYHIPHQVAYALTGAVRAGPRTRSSGAPPGTRRPTGGLSPADERMLELLAPFAGQRARVVHLLLAACPAPPRLAPRAPLRSFAHF